MADINKGTVVYTIRGRNGRAAVTPLDPDIGGAGTVTTGHALIGVTQSDSDLDDPVSILRSGYLRGLTSAHVIEWPVTEGASLWCGADGKLTTTRPERGLQVFVGTWIGDGVLDVRIRMQPSIGDLSYVKREEPVLYDVFIYDPSEGCYVPRQIDHGQDLAGLEGDDHPQYVLRDDLSSAFLFMGGD